MSWSIVNAENGRVAATFDDRDRAGAAIKQATDAGYALINAAGVPLAWSPPTSPQRREALARRLIARGQATPPATADAAPKPAPVGIDAIRAAAERAKGRAPAPAPTPPTAPKPAPPAPAPPRAPAPPPPEEPVLRDEKSESKSDEKPAPARAQRCTWPEARCDNDQAPVRSDTHANVATFCAYHRARVRGRGGVVPGAPVEAAAAKRGPARAPKPTPVPPTAKAIRAADAKVARKAAAKKTTRAVVKVRGSGARKQVEFPIGAADLVVRSLKVVEQLGGVERAEKIAAAIGGAP